ncbi:hypothetical protein BB558_007033 [Smittium angustum]|uniref:Acyl-CoA thioesterase II n=1 Tax=Smittium angustum TaxID=133377 RepID=A0A2U1IW35_SMIAN|nr:hypothetical protein BB558_007033 [Smittium angustum]
MEKVKSDIKEYFFVEEVSKDLFVSTYSWKFGAARGLFGGQVISQTLAAAILTVEPEFSVHSMHSYFLLAGKYDTPLYFHVKRLRDGRSFASRSVLAKQDGNTIFSLTCSFQKPESRPANIQYKMPDVYPPEYKHYEIYDHKNHEPHGSIFLRPDLNVSIFDKYKFESRTATHKDPEICKVLEAVPDSYGSNGELKSRHGDETGPPYNLRWFRINENLEKVSKQVHFLAIAFMSDFWAPCNVSVPYFWGYNEGKLELSMMTTLDNSVWFHSDLRSDEWLLFESESPTVVGGRQLIKGRFYTSSGRYVASFTQENVYRTKVLKPDARSRLEYSHILPKLVEHGNIDKKVDSKNDFKKLPKL